MARSKRKVDVEDLSEPATTSNKKQKQDLEQNSLPRRSSRSSLAAAAAPRSTRSSVSKPSPTAKNDTGKRSKPAKAANTSAKRTPVKKSVSKTTIKAKKAGKNTEEVTTNDDRLGALKTKLSVDVPQSTKSFSDTKEEHDRELEEHSDGPSYWLMKAEPESRIEKGKDVKFSIDDLKAATAPEGWDGVRNAVARNNMRLMMKGDMAFFYHSNCKVPGIAGTMEIVQEHSVDETAFDPEHPYYDEKSDREKPKWCLVHVEFRRKFPELVKLKELQKFAKDGGVLEHLQTLKQSRLSVSKVTKKEWDFIMGLVDTED